MFAAFTSQVWSCNKDCIYVPWRRHAQEMCVCVSSRYQTTTERVFWSIAQNQRTNPGISLWEIPSQLCPKDGQNQSKREIPFLNYHKNISGTGYLGTAEVAIKKRTQRRHTQCQPQSSSMAPWQRRHRATDCATDCATDWDVWDIWSFCSAYISTQRRHELALRGEFHRREFPLKRELAGFLSDC